MDNFIGTIEKVKTIEEHISIIREYQQSGYLDRKKAVEKFKMFNQEHPDYTSITNAAFLASKNLIQIDYATDEIIVSNLKLQAVWIIGKEKLKSFGIDF